jgi:D-arabinose 1-dehydrogenase-like Zn-dependent alcohol dehydrogenase
MRAAVITQFNQPWQLTTVPDPRPQGGQVVIRIRACGMCGTDVHVHHGYLPVTPPIVPGHEPVGEIAEVGPGVRNLKVGDRVGVHWVQRGCGRCRACFMGRPQYCATPESWMTLGGGDAEYMLAAQEGCTLLPEGMRWEDAAPVFCAGFTVFSGLRNAKPKPGERVAVLGVGGLGHLALQYSKALGLETMAITGSETKVREAREFGADHVVVSGSDVGKAVLEAGGADVILSTTNSAAQVGQALGGLRPEGRLVNMGVLDGPLTIPDTMGFILGQKHLLGSSQDERSDLVEALELVANGKVRPRLEVYKLEEANAVRDRLAAGKVRYRAVLMV